MKKQLLLIALFAGTVGGSFAQQDKVLTHFMYDRTTVNPAATALTRNSICGTFIYRNQWDKINGAPNSGTFNVEADLNQYVPNFFAGISFFQDMVGFNRQNFATLNAGYSFQSLLGFDLRAGVGLGIMNHSVTPNWLPPQTLNDANLTAPFSKTAFDANFGLYARHTMISNGHKWNAGISMTHLPAPNLESGINNSAGIPIGFQSARHMYFMGGYTVTGLNGGTGEIDIQTMTQTDFVEFSTQLSVRYIHNNMLYGGLNFRSEDMVGLMAGVKPFALASNSGSTSLPAQLNRMMVGYAYDFSINQLSSISQGSHEIFVRYCHPLPGIPMTISKHPRWL
ncbi:MAG: PorP/SprF family type IX secretion system membrane protein [bacterium]|nr:PorP/SprF family type IX secretion system membrane protein [bacterium]